jgi:hypothetical protein
VEAVVVHHFLLLLVAVPKLCSMLPNDIVAREYQLNSSRLYLVKPSQEWVVALNTVACPLNDRQIAVKVKSQTSFLPLIWWADQLAVER